MKEMTQNKLVAIGIIILVVISMAAASGVTLTITAIPGCWHQSPIPPPESPIVTVPVEKPPSGELMREYASVEIWWDDPSVPQGYVEAYCVSMEPVTMYLDWRLKDGEGFIVYGGRIEIGESTPMEIGTGLFAGPFTFMADLDPEPKTVTVWVRPWWDLRDAGCVNVDGNPIEEVIGVYVPPEGQATYQDEERYWLVRTVEGYAEIYLPMVTK